MQEDIERLKQLLQEIQKEHGVSIEYVEVNWRVYVNGRKEVSDIELKLSLTTS